MKLLLGLMGFLMLPSLGSLGNTNKQANVLNNDGIEVIRAEDAQSDPKKYASGASIGDIVPKQDKEYRESGQSKAYLIAKINNGPLSNVSVTTISGPLSFDRIVSNQTDKIEFTMTVNTTLFGDRYGTTILLSGYDANGDSVSKQFVVYFSRMNNRFCVSTVSQEQADMFIALNEWKANRISTQQFNELNDDANSAFIDYETSTTGNTYYTFKLKDSDNRVSPLKYVAVGCLNSQGTVLSTLHTDASGRIYKSSIASGTDHLRLFSYSKLTSSNQIVRVEKTQDFSDSYYFQDIDLVSNGYGATVTFNTEKYGSTSYLGRALQTLRPLIFGAKYVKDMSGSFPALCPAVYPYKEGCYHNNNGIFLRDTAYLGPDVILHEYGHRIQKIYNLSRNPGGTHYFSGYSLPADDKDKGLRLTWGEAWPTVFGNMVGQYFPGEFNNYSGIDYYYDSDDGWNANLETGFVRYGEGCEHDIIAVLYDMFDPSNEAHDHMALGHQGLWDLMISAGQNCNLETFDDFADYFCSTHSFDEINSFGEIMAEWGFSPDPVVNGVGTVSQAPLITWRKTNTAYSWNWTLNTSITTFASTRYEITFFDGWRSTLFTRTSYSESYRLSSSDWSTLMNSYGSCYYIRVSSFQENGNRYTGGYNSNLILVTKPVPADLTGSISWNPSNRLVRQSINLAVGQSIMYNITVSRSDDTVFQTVGKEGIRMYLYDNNYNLLAQTGLHTGYHAHGYAYNGLIRYYCQAGVTYKLKVESFDTSYAINCNKLLVCQPLAFTQDWRPYNCAMDLDDINHDNFTYGLWCDRYKVSLFNYTPVADGKHTVELSSEFDTYCYVIDTYTSDVYYDDDSGNGLNAKVVVNNMVGGREYLIAFCQYNPNSALSTSNSVDVHMWKN
ncbi:MAG: hypothetical protein IKQ78_00180 [Bacilli bacterium]|nr:hypothetical protein [Bacilli bacterium]MBR6225620.1 hypothetical protein [Bacilli bacterium]